MKYVYFVRGEAHARLAATSMESVKVADPSATIVVWSDDPLMPELAFKYMNRATLRQFDSRGAPIMLANVEAQARALYEAREPVAFLDTDTIVLEPLRDPGADLLVTWRDRIGVDEEGKPVVGIAATMPYNYGVIVAGPSLASLEAFVWMRERIRLMSAQLQRWYGNQVALAALCGRPPKDGERTDDRQIPWGLTSSGLTVTVRKVPCEEWNYTPADAEEHVHGKRKVLHFKGKSRGLMGAYAKRLGLPWAMSEAAA